MELLAYRYLENLPIRQIYLFSCVTADVQYYCLWNHFSKLRIIYKWKIEFMVNILPQLFAIWELQTGLG